MQGLPSGTRLAAAVYALYALGLFTGGLGTLVGLFVAHAKAAEMRGTIHGSHLGYLIRTGWWSIAGMVAGFLTTWVLIGFLVMPIVTVWYVYRVVTGAIKLKDDRPA